VENREFSEMGLDVLCALSLPLPPAAADLWPISYTYCNNLPIANMLMQPTPRRTPAAHAETGLLPTPDAVDVLPIDLKLKARPNYCGAPKAVNITSQPY